MIKTKEEYHYYLNSDLLATGLHGRGILDRIVDRRFKFYKSLRLTEYYTNCRQDSIGKLIAKFLRLRHRLICDRYNWTIPINVFKEGLAIVHVGPIVVSHKARIGKNCRIHICVNIGSAWVRGVPGAPVIGDNVYLGPGVKMYGPITIGDNVAIGANAVVNTSFVEGNCSIGGIPAKVVSSNDSSRYILNYQLNE